MIYLQPLGSVDPDILRFLIQELSAIWEMNMLTPAEVPADAFCQGRRQFDALTLLKALPVKEDAVLGVTNIDVYVDGLNFVFGLAVGKRAVISLCRLRPEFYGSATDDELFRLRALKEAVHELGHVFGLDHCGNRGCVMHFSNSILDTDLKEWRCCGLCEWKIMRRQPATTN